MPSSIGMEIEAQVLALHRSSPELSALQVLDAVMHDRRCRLAEFAEVLPGTEFGELLAAAFEPAPGRVDWRRLGRAETGIAVAVLLLREWHAKVMAPFAMRYRLGV